MGLFDTVHCEYPLPIAEAQALDFQTKSLRRFMDHFKIDINGYLWQEHYETEDQSDPNTQGIERMFGCMTRINQRWEEESYTGEILFYTHLDKEYKRWVEFSAYFTRGKLQILNVISDGSFKDENS